MTEYFKTTFEIDGLKDLKLKGIQFENDYWNGFARPYLDAENTQKLADHLQKEDELLYIVKFKDDYYHIDITDENNLYIDRLDSTEIEGTTYYDCSIGWVWDHETLYSKETNFKDI